ncbi:MAG: flagellar hook-length control protein FliK [Bdellovibrionales bacterium]|nr:flagellar hook-length control protein FliK [Bdellovibrionales bacterium]
MIDTKLGLLGNLGRNKSLAKDAAPSKNTKSQSNDFDVFSSTKESKANPTNSSSSPQSGISESNFKSELKSQESRPSSRPVKETARDTAPVKEGSSSESDEVVSVDEKSDTQKNSKKAIAKDGLKREKQDYRTSYLAAENAIQKPMMNFMSVMEEDYGIDPEQVLSSLSEMSDDELLNPPRETMTKFLDNLDVQDEQRQQVESLYTGMLNQIEMADQKAGRFDKKVKMEVISPKEIRQKRLSESIESLNKKFFLNDTRPQFGKMNADGQKVDGKIIQNDPSQRVDQLNKSFYALDDLQGNQRSNEQGQENQNRAAGAVVGAVPVFNQSPQPISQTPQPMSADGVSDSVLKSLQEVTRDDSVDFDPQGQGVSGNNAPAFASPFALAQMEGFEGEESSLGGESSNDFGEVSAMKAGDDEGDEKIEGHEKFDELVHHLDGDQAQMDLSVDGPEVDSFSRIEPNNLEKTQNLREIVQGARALVRDGGGEMNIRLSPEGMGEIQLKVAVNKGNVDIQMLTNNSETKRHLESTINDLKNGLASQKLNLETVKVDMNQAGLGQDFDMTQSGQQQRHMAQEFLQQFRDNNNSFRNAFYAGPERGTKNPEDRPEIKMEDSKSQRSDGKSKHLNVIA